METISMNRYKQFIGIAVTLLFTSIVCGQEKYKEVFTAKENVEIILNSKYTNVVIETWNKNKVEVVAEVNKENLSLQNQKQIFDSWQVSAIGNSSKIEINSHPKTAWGRLGKAGEEVDVEMITELEFVHPLIESIVNPIVENLTKAPITESMAKDMSDLDFDYEAYKKDPEAYMEKWNLEIEKAVSKNSIKNQGKIKSKRNLNDKYGFLGFPKSPFSNSLDDFEFDDKAYHNDKKGYLAKLNKKYNTKVTTKEVDVWLEEMKKWEEDITNKAENWAEKFEHNINEWGEDFEIKMEHFGKKIEHWASKIALEFEEERNGNEVHKIIKFHEHPHSHAKNSNRVLKIKVPKNARFNLRIRYGSVDIDTVFNEIDAEIDYASLHIKDMNAMKSAINVSYSDMKIDTWNKGQLNLNYVKKCVLGSVNDLTLSSNSSDVHLLYLRGQSIINGSFGELSIDKIGSDFKNLDVVLENTDAKLKLPKTNYSIYYNGNKSKINYPEKLNVSESKSGTVTILKGYSGKKNNTKDIHIAAKYSDVILE